MQCNRLSSKMANIAKVVGLWWWKWWKVDESDTGKLLGSHRYTHTHTQASREGLTKN